MAAEIELRFRVGPGILDRLRQATPDGVTDVRPVVTRTLSSTYFDLPDRSLGSRGFGIRLRVEDGQRSLTIKADDGHGWFGARREWVAAQAGAVPRLGRLGRHLPPEASAGPLSPVFRTRIERTLRDLRIGRAARVELALDRGVIYAGRHRRAVREIEIELKRGAVMDLYAVALRLHRDFGPFALMPSSKAVRGYALAAGRPEAARRADAVAIDVGASTEAACKAILRSCLGQILANHEPARLGKDSEGVHQIRIGLRRLRTALSSLRPFLPPERRQPVAAWARWATRHFGPARDWDVFIDERLAPALARIGDGDPGVHLRTAAQAERAAAYRLARRALRAARYTEAMLDALQWLEEPWNEAVGKRRRQRLATPFVDIAWRLMRDADRRLRARANNLDEGDPAVLHAVRLAAKKARYMAEFLAPIAPPGGVEPYVKALKRVQDTFGRSSDDTVAADRLTTLLSAVRVDAPQTLIDAITPPADPTRARLRLRSAWRAYEATMPLHRALGHHT
ncbi:MAG: CHAD domain-containing protein [Alphaproteobacteria bacterium]